MNTYKAFRGIAAVVVALTVAGCASHTQRELLTPEQLAELSVPLDVREYRTSRSGGMDAIFIKLSRLPDGIDHHAEAVPASIVIDVKGPVGAATVDEETIQGQSPLSRIRVARAPKVLRLSLDLERGVVPPYSVSLLADWIMIRLESSGVEG